MTREEADELPGDLPKEGDGPPSEPWAQVAGDKREAGFTVTLSELHDFLTKVASFTKSWR